MTTDNKSEFRQALLRKRDAIPPEVRRAKDRFITEKVMELEETKRAGTPFFFASFRSEIGTGAMISASLAAGKRVVVPKVDRSLRQLTLYEIRDPGELSPGYMGIPEPTDLTDARRVEITEVDAVFLPGAAFDLKGNRIGYGGGYYDRLLALITRPTPLIAPAYEEQVVEAVPAEPHDIRVHIIVTDRRIIRTTVISD